MKTDFLSNPAQVNSLACILKSVLDVKGEIRFSIPTTCHTYAVIIVSCDGTPRFVVKLLRSFRRFLKVGSRLSVLNRLNLPVPRLVYWSATSRATSLGHYVLIQEFIPGNSLEDSSRANERDLRKVATAFAALHSVSRPNLALVIPSLKRGSYLRRGPYIRFHLRHTLSILAALSGHLSSNGAEKLAARFRVQAQPLLRRTRYELVHADVKPAHIVMTEHSAWLVDLDEVHYGDYPSDLVPALHLICNDDEEKKRVFLERYFQEVKGVGEMEFQQYERFYHGHFHLRMAAYHAGCMEQGRQPASVARPLMQQQIEHCHAALAQAV